MRNYAFRRPLCLLLLFASPFAGLWFGEERVPLVSIFAASTLLILAFGAALISPSPLKREKYYVLLAATVMFVGAWAAGQALVKQAYNECFKRGDEVRAALEDYRIEHGSYPSQLDWLDIKIPGKLRLHAPLLRYRPMGQDYRLSFKADNVQFEASRHTPFVAHRQED